MQPDKHGVAILNTGAHRVVADTVSTVRPYKLRADIDMADNGAAFVTRPYAQQIVNRDAATA